MKKTVLILSLALLALIVKDAQSQMFWNQAGQFSGGSNSYAAIPHSSSLNITTDFTIECWLYPTGSGTRYILFKGNSYSMNLDGNNKLAINTGGVNPLRSSSPVPNNRWTHISVSYTGGEFNMFLDGQFDTSRFVNLPAVIGTDSLLIGKRDSGSGFSGIIDELRIWNKGLATDLVIRNMRTSLGATGGRYNGLVLSTTFQNDNSNSGIFTLFDWSGNGNTGFNRGITQVDYRNRPPTYLSLNEALKLDGASGSYFAVPNHSSFDGGGALTMEAWVYMSQYTPGQSQYIISKNLGAVTSGYRMFLGGNDGRFTFGSTTNSTSNYYVPLRQWTHLAVTISSTGSARAYANGVLISSPNLPIPVANTDSLFIGRGHTAGLNFNGYIDEVRISKFERTPEQIKEYLYKSIDAANDPAGTDIVWNFDGYARDNGNHSVRGYFRGNAMFSSPGTQTNIPVSPLNREDNISFFNGFRTKTADRRIPSSGTSGTVIDDTLAVNQSTPINNIKLFVAINHTDPADLEIVLIAPNGDSAKVMDDFTFLGSNDGIVTVFDDNADSSQANGKYVQLISRIKPLNSFNVFTGDNPLGQWRLRIRDDNAGDTGRVYSWGIQINDAILVGIEEPVNEVPTKFSLEQNYPNPFNPVTNIKFSIPVTGMVKLKVYDILGKEMAVLVNKQLNAGSYQADFNGSNFASGVYFYKLEAEEFTEIKKMTLVK